MTNSQSKPYDKQSWLHFFKIHKNYVTKMNSCQLKATYGSVRLEGHRGGNLPQR